MPTVNGSVNELVTLCSVQCERYVGITRGVEQFAEFEI